MDWINTLIALAGVVAALAAVAVGYWIGRKQGQDGERAYQLSLRRAVPRIGTRMELVASPVDNVSRQILYSIQTTIYNDGDLVASKLEGNWKLSSSYSFLNAERVIREDSLPGPLPIKINHDLGYHRQNVWSSPGVFLKVDIDLTYLGFENKQQRYQTTYEYYPKSDKMISSGSKAALDLTDLR